MRSSILGLAVFAVVAGTFQEVAASDPVTGTISCVAEGELFYRNPYLPTPLGEPLTTSMRVVGRTEFAAPCDVSGVSGGKTEIIGAEARFNGKLGSGTTCESFLGTLDLTGNVKLRWRGGNAQRHYVTVGTSKATVASAAFDSATESWVVVTNPIARGAFAGSTVTMRFHMYDAASYEETCTTNTFRFTGWRATAENPWTIDVQ